jgi:hypothetical protein
VPKELKDRTCCMQFELFGERWATRYHQQARGCEEIIAHVYTRST